MRSSPHEPYNPGIEVHNVEIQEPQWDTVHEFFLAVIEGKKERPRQVIPQNQTFHSIPLQLLTVDSDKRHAVVASIFMLRS